MRDQEIIEELLRSDWGHKRLNRCIQQVMDNENWHSTGRGDVACERWTATRTASAEAVSDQAGDETFQPLFTPIGAEPMRWLRYGRQKQF